MIADLVQDELATTIVEGALIRLSDRDEFLPRYTSIESALDEIAKHTGHLMHGTGDLIAPNSALKLSPGRERWGVQRQREAFATDVAAIAILKALFSNRSGVNLRYPWTISYDKPLKLLIKNYRPRGRA